QVSSMLWRRIVPSTPCDWSSRTLPICFTPCTRASSFFFTATPTTEIYTLSLHDALPILHLEPLHLLQLLPGPAVPRQEPGGVRRSEEHTSELQSRENLVCRLLLEKKKKTSARNESSRHDSSDAARHRGRSCCISALGCLR